MINKKLRWVSFLEHLFTWNNALPDDYGCGEEFFIGTWQYFVMLEAPMSSCVTFTITSVDLTTQTPFPLGIWLRLGLVSASRVQLGQGYQEMVPYLILWVLNFQYVCIINVLCRTITFSSRVVLCLYSHSIHYLFKFQKTGTC